jgi:RND family efflux transporter MFP subunit
MKQTSLKIGLFIVCCLILFSCSSKKEEQAEESVSTVLPDEITEVRAMRLELTDFNHDLIANGVVSSHDKADLRFQSSELIAAIYVKNGDHVNKGQRIAELDSFVLKNTMAQARFGLEQARLSLQDVLIGQGYSLADSAKAPESVMRLARIKSGYDQSINQYAMAEYNYKNSVLYAPFSGVVANLFDKVHNKPGGAEPFCTILDNSRMETDFKILESELPFVRVGDNVQVSPFSVNDYVGEGRLVEINPVIDKNGMVRVKASISNPQNKLYEGMNVKVRLQRSLGKQLVIPKEALVLRTNKKVVFTLKDEHAQWVYVQTGLENSTSYVVTDGLAAGDSVIYEGNINLAHETPVKLRIEN